MMIVAKKSKRKLEKAGYFILGVFYILITLLVLLIAVFGIAEAEEPIDILVNLFYSVVTILVGTLGAVIFFSNYALFCKLPEIIAEFDGHYLYIHGKKEAKIHVLELKDARAYSIGHHNPNVYLRLKDKRKFKIPIPNDVCETINRLQGIIHSIKV